MEGASTQIKDERSCSIFAKLLSANRPAVLKNRLKSWTSIPMTIADLKEKYGSVKLKFRVVHIIQPASQVWENYEHWKTITNNPIWESDCPCILTSISNFLEWVYETIPFNCDDNPFHIFPRQDFWIYSSYNYMQEFIAKDADFMKGVDWSVIGFPNLGAKDSSFWFGSPSSSTPFHMDTYGSNFVAQLIGRKQWVLFPPEDKDNVYMTRIPYEESSIFSQVNVYNPDFKEFPLFKKTHPHIIDLEPGDVLFVPPKWWHFVTSQSTSFSINTWIDMDIDKEARIEEAIVKTLMSALIPTFDIDNKELPWTNPGENLMKPENVKDLMAAVLNAKEVEQCLVEATQSDVSSHVSKSQKKAPNQDVHSSREVDIDDDDVVFVPAMRFAEFHQNHCYHSPISEVDSPSPPPDTAKSINLKSIVNSFVHPDVVACIAKQLKALKGGASS